jgi:hypothetical protein
MRHGFLDHAEGTIFEIFSPFVTYNVLLISEGFLINVVQQVTHAVRFEPKGKLELVARNRFVKVCPIVARSAVVVAGACTLQKFEETLLRSVFGLLKHHVLEQMRESGSSLGFVHGTDVVPRD